MPTTYELCGKEVDSIVTKVMSKYQPALSAEGVTIQAVFARNEDDDGEPLPAIRMHGVARAAKIQITSLQDRARGIPDAKLLIDQTTWGRLSEAKRDALIDHELEHLDLVRKSPEKGGGVKVDDLGRPKLKGRPHDWELSGFQAVAERHRENSIETVSMKNWQDRYGQLLMFPPKDGKK